VVIVDVWPFYSAALQMMERLRAAETTTRIPVLVLTSAISADHRRRALGAGCAAYLEKPCGPERLWTQLHLALGLSAAGQPKVAGWTGRAAE
jgi:DNA-binding response OmpR family regulator